MNPGSTVQLVPEQFIFCAADVDPAVFQRLFLVDLFLRRRRFPGGENICRNQVSQASQFIIASTPEALKSPHNPHTQAQAEHTSRQRGAPVL